MLGPFRRLLLQGGSTTSAQRHSKKHTELSGRRATAGLWRQRDVARKAEAPMHAPHLSPAAYLQGRATYPVQGDGLGEYAWDLRWKGSV